LGGEGRKGGGKRSEREKRAPPYIPSNRKNAEGRPVEGAKQKKKPLSGEEKGGPRLFLI